MLIDLFSDLHGVMLSQFVGNQLNIPIDFKDRSNEDIITYVRTMQGDSLVETSRVKVMLLGPGMGGKTTLVQKLIKNKFKHNQYEMTDGVDMHTWEHEKVEFQLWDFGGQEIYMNTHAMFFETRCIYIITWNSRAPYANDIVKMLEQYFQDVQNRAPDAPILLVSTHAKNVSPLSTESLQHLRAKYPTILGYVHVDSKHSVGIEELKNTLLDSTHGLPYVRSDQPSKFVDVEKRVKSKRSPDRFYLPPKAFIAISGKYSLNDKQSALLLSLLHQWGTVHVLSKGAIVLQPQQLADVMRRVVTCKTLAAGAVPATRDGVLRHVDIDAIWRMYPDTLRQQFLDLLHSCELAFPLYNAAGDPLYQSLVPAMLADEHSSLDEMAQRCFVDFDSHEQVGAYGKIAIKFKAHSTNFFPMLQARLRAMATRDGAWKQYYFICLEDQQSGDLCTALLHNDLPNREMVVLFPLAQSLACSAALRAMRYLLDEHFKALVITGLNYVFGNTILRMINLVQLLKSNRNATYQYKGNGGENCWAPLGPLRVLLKELDQPVVAAPVASVHDILAHGALAAALQRAQQEGSTTADKADLSIALIRSIPDVVRLCDLDHERVDVIWLYELSEKLIVPVCPGKSARDAWKFVQSAAVPAKKYDMTFTPACTIVLNSLIALGLPINAKVFYLGSMRANHDQIVKAQAKYFEKTTIADGVEAYLEKTDELNMMYAMQEILATQKRHEEKLDRVLSTVLNIDAVLKDFRREFDLAVVQVGRQLAGLRAERLYDLSERMDATVERTRAAPVSTAAELEDLITTMRTQLFASDAITGDLTGTDNNTVETDVRQIYQLAEARAPFRQLLDVLSRSARESITQGELLKLKADAIAAAESLAKAMHVATHNKLLTRELEQSVVAQLLAQAAAAGPTSVAAIPANLTAEDVRAVLQTELAALEKRLSTQLDSYQQSEIKNNVLRDAKIDEIINKVAKLQKDVSVVRDMNVDSLYRLRDLPVLFSVTDPDATGLTGKLQRGYATVYRVYCVCPVCGKRAPSGPNKTGYKLVVTKDWVVKLSNIVTVLLKAVEIISLASPWPLKHLSDLAAYLPKDLSLFERGLGNLLDATQSAVNERFGSFTEVASAPLADQPTLTGSTIPASAAASASAVGAGAAGATPGTATGIPTPTHTFPVTYDYIISILSMMTMLQETVPLKYSELRPVRFSERDQYAWVCKDSSSSAALPVPPTASTTAAGAAGAGSAGVPKIPKTSYATLSGNTAARAGSALKSGVLGGLSILSDRFAEGVTVGPAPVLTCVERFEQSGNECLSIVIDMK